MDRLSYDTVLARDLASIPARAHHDRLFRDMLFTVWRRRGVVLAVFLLSMALGLGALAILPRKYTSEAIVQLDLATQEGVPATVQGQGVALEGASLVQSEARIIQSRMIARRVVDRLGLADDPGFAPREGVLARILERISGEPGEPSQTASAGSEAAENALMAATNVTTDTRSYLITITATSGRSAMSARIANAVAGAYLQWRMEANHEAANKMADWLAGQIENTTRALREAEARVISYQQEHGLLDVPNGGQNVQQQQLRSLSDQLSAASLDRINAEARLARVEGLARSGQVPSAADLRGSPVIQQLIEREAAARNFLGEKTARLGPQHPDVARARAALAELQGSIATEVKRAESISRGDLAAAERAERDLRTRLDSMRQAEIANGTNETELKDLQASSEIVKDRLIALTRMQDQALAARDSRFIAASLIAPAEPTRKPAFPKPAVVLALSLVGGLGIGVCIAVMLERGDQGVRSSADLKGWADARCLGMVPELRPRGSGGRRRRGGAPNTDQAIFDESIRSVGAALNLFGSVQGCRVVLVTSSVPDEGKSVVCNALANALVAAGQRVLLVDGPPRRDLDQTERVRSIEASPESPPEPGTSLTVLNRSSKASLAADVFSSIRFGSLLNEARKHFDVILLEGPPVMVLADSLVLGRPADSVIHVVRWASTRQRVVEAALDRLRESSVLVDGVVLTRVDLRRHALLRTVDQCFYYVKERRLFEYLAGTGGACPPDQSRAT